MRNILIASFIIIFSIPSLAQLNKHEFNFSGSGDLTMPLGRYQIGTALNILWQTSGGWAEKGGEYHISGGWHVTHRLSTSCV